MRLVVAIVIVIIAGIIGPDGHARTKNTETEQKIRKLERQFIYGFIQRDLTKLDQVLSASFLLTHSNGVIVNKTQYLDELRRGDIKYSSSVIDGDYVIRIYGNAAVVTGRATSKGTSHGQDFVRHIRFTRVYVNQAGLWEMVALHATAIAKP